MWDYLLSYVCSMCKILPSFIHVINMWDLCFFHMFATVYPKLIVSDTRIIIQQPCLVIECREKNNGKSAASQLKQNPYLVRGQTAKRFSWPIQNLAHFSIIVFHDHPRFSISFHSQTSPHLLFTHGFFNSFEHAQAHDSSNRADPWL